MTDGQRIVARAAAFAAQGFVLPCSIAAATPQAPHPAARRIADDMLDIAGAGSCVVEEDLLLRGWSRDDLARHGDAAREIANAATVRSAH